MKKALILAVSLMLSLSLAAGVGLAKDRSPGTKFKGTVQELRSLGDNSKIKLTIANWVLPDGTVISEDGLKPDNEVKITETDTQEGKDPQLEKAIEVLRAEIAEKK